MSFEKKVKKKTIWINQKKKLESPVHVQVVGYGDSI